MRDERKARADGLPLWARLGIASPFRLEVALWIAALMTAAAGGVLLLALLLSGEAR